MPSLNFQQQFAGSVEQGNKKQTIRRKRKFPIKANDPLYLFTGMRTAKCRRLRNTHCDEVFNIFINSNKSVILDNKVLTDGEKHELAVADGFIDFSVMFQFFKETGGLPVDGQLIKWL